MRQPNYQILLYHVYAFKGVPTNTMGKYPNLIGYLSIAHKIQMEEVRTGRKVKLAITIEV